MTIEQSSFDSTVSNEIYHQVTDIVIAERAAGFKSNTTDLKLIFELPESWGGLLAVRAAINGSLDTDFEVGKITLALGERAHAVAQTFLPFMDYVRDDFVKEYLRALDHYPEHKHEACLGRYEFYPFAIPDDPADLFNDLEYPESGDSSTHQPNDTIPIAFFERQAKNKRHVPN